MTPTLDDVTVLTVKGMTCASCQIHVQHALEAVPGVASASVNLMAHTAQITSTSPLDANALITAVRNSGYDASLPTTAGDSHAAHDHDSMEVTAPRPPHPPRAHRRSRRHAALHAADDGSSSTTNPAASASRIARRLRSAHAHRRSWISPPSPSAGSSARSPSPPCSSPRPRSTPPPGAPRATAPPT